MIKSTYLNFLNYWDNLSKEIKTDIFHLSMAYVSVPTFWINFLFFNKSWF